ncbi:MAG: sigma-54-dependent Fis family transcriptional regulator [Gammaproteobacteria bacterium]|nr:sigma-54-dependent Fis family transcriptional regulator [Gammaproteobacteria bacterium]
MDVLIVDDSETVLLLLQEVVAQRGHRVTACIHPACALEAFQEAPYPLVLMDWVMPGMSGLELAGKFRSLPGGESCYILMITGRAEPDDLARALDAGANDYIVKPCDISVLNVRLTIAEKQSRLLADRYRSEKELDKTLAKLASSHNDMREILNHICIGTVLTGESDEILFVSNTACSMFEAENQRCLGKSWQQAFPFKHADMLQITEMARRKESEREKLHLHLRTPGNHYYWVDLMIRDDPRGERSRIFLFQDMTEVRDLRQRLDDKSQFQDIVGKSRPMMLLYQQIHEIAPSDITVLIDGETGAGKEMVARAIHDLSHRNKNPFIAVNCAGLADALLTSQLFGHVRGAFTGAIKDQKGLFEAAEGGTLFLDEIGEISVAMQTALLRALQEREVTRVGENLPRKVNVRIIAATNRDLDKEVAAGNFRADLMYRIRVAHLRLPPLRERLEDIPLLVNLFLVRYRAASGKEMLQLGQSALRRLTDYSWPGNVRELENAIEVAALRCKGHVIEAADLPLSLQDQKAPAREGATIPLGAAAAPRTAQADETPERQRILDALTQARGSRKEAARLLGMSRATFYRRVEQHEIEL